MMVYVYVMLRIVIPRLRVVWSSAMKHLVHGGGFRPVHKNVWCNRWWAGVEQRGQAAADVRVPEQAGGWQPCLRQYKVLWQLQFLWQT
jgi:hypothetical protein